VRVLVVTNMYPAPDNPAVGVVVEQQVRSLRKLGVDVEVLHFNRTTQGPWVYRRVRRALRQAVDRVQPDVVHITYGGIMALLAARSLRDRPFIIYFRGSDLLGSREEPLPRRFTIYLGVLASRRAAPRAAGALVDSENLRSALPRGAARGNVWIVPSGIDLERFAPRDRDECRFELGWPLQSKQVLFTASPGRPEKRYHLARAAVARLRDGGCDVTLRVLDGVTHSDVPTWMNASDVVLLTSTHEGSPNAVKEALACNVPVVAVDVGDVRQRLSIVPGCFVGAPTVEDLADKLRQVLASGRRVDGRQSLSEISLARTAERLREIYQSVIDEHAATRSEAS
jgi:teichuronic acid biosynthesis glycosyltransferase TuaC